MSQPIPPDVEIPTLHQTVPSHWRTHPLEIPWVTERAPMPDAVKSTALQAPWGAGPGAALSEDESQSSFQPAIAAPDGVPPAASELQAQTDLQRQAADQSAEFEIEQLVNQVLQATAVHPQQAEDLQSEAEHQVLANQVVERVQARIASLLPDLVHEVMSEIQPSPTDTGKPSDPQELK